VLVRLGVPAVAITTVGRGKQGLLVRTGDGVREPQDGRVGIVMSPPIGGRLFHASPIR
jgi:hypothetical protein